MLPARPRATCVRPADAGLRRDDGSIGLDRIVATLAAATAVDRAVAETTEPSGGTTTEAVAPAPPRPTRARREPRARRARRPARSEGVTALRQHGYSQVAIGEQVGLDRKTIRRDPRADGVPERAAAAVRSTIPAPDEGARRAGGRHHAHRVRQAIRSRGVPGAAALVRPNVDLLRPRLRYAA